VAMFGAIGRIGPRLTMLLTHCLAAPLAAITEWLWLGTRLGLAEIACALVILGGVALALAPDRGVKLPRRAFRIGVLWGLASASAVTNGAWRRRRQESSCPSSRPCPCSRNSSRGKSRAIIRRGAPSSAESSPSPASSPSRRRQEN